MENAHTDSAQKWAQKERRKETGGEEMTAEEERHVEPRRGQEGAAAYVPCRRKHSQTQAARAASRGKRQTESSCSRLEEASELLLQLGAAAGQAGGGHENCQPATAEEGGCL